MATSFQQVNIYFFTCLTCESEIEDVWLTIIKPTDQQVTPWYRFYWAVCSSCRPAFSLSGCRWTHVNLSCKPSPSAVHVMVIRMLLGSSARDYIMSVYILSKHQKGGWIDVDHVYRKRPIEIRCFMKIRGAAPTNYDLKLQIKTNGVKHKSSKRQIGLHTHYIMYNIYYRWKRALWNRFDWLIDHIRLFL